ncbi:IclR family transcriptional regulator [Natronococcus amylolyticus DSM 10524]|uniref:IclR family transcriptional regulator n=1 Tax=Natronococcus amylolyticus DSM 10524 TaxID=1227497 RepID=L9X3M0_9EURY|nr:IclR family transcriptional regulator C-terminal domain-containing protein [Natronococcus amylolyticus]ELY56041.1 IclR family transcriptional regulator [Natronococcus amylolyticus DSM 10524]
MASTTIVCLTTGQTDDEREQRGRRDAGYESTTHRHRRTLQDLMYISRHGERSQIRLRFSRLRRAAQTRDLACEITKPHVQTLAEETGERTQSVVEDLVHSIYFHAETSERGVLLGFGAGRQIRLHGSSVGKAILENYPRKYVDDIIDRWGLITLTKNTIIDLDKLETARERGIVFNRKEHVSGVNGTAVPVKRDGDILGTLVVAGPSTRPISELFEEELPDMMLATVNGLESNLTYSPSGSADDHIVE